VIDSATLFSLKERYEGCDMLLGTSPLVCVTASSKPQKPFVVSVTNPSGGSKKPKTGGGSAGAGTRTPAANAGAAATEGGGTSLPKASVATRPMIGGGRQAGKLINHRISRNLFFSPVHLDLQTTEFIPAFIITN
jgi:hypothetical protein